MAENADSTSRAIARYIGSKVGIRTEFVVDMPWEQREYLFDIGEIQVCWICGLPYVWKVDAGQPAIELCAVPVMLRERYGNAPVYFSDVAVHRDSHFETFDDLRGTSWSYNERRSHSGYNVVRHLLAQIGETGGYFGRVIESGSHQASLRMILDRKIDASAIDSTVLETEFPGTLQSNRRYASSRRLAPAPCRHGLSTRMFLMSCDPPSQRPCSKCMPIRMGAASSTDGAYRISRLPSIPTIGRFKTWP
jgi:phosphonate transport system substrate-binding protein